MCFTCSIVLDNSKRSWQCRNNIWFVVRTSIFKIARNLYVLLTIHLCDKYILYLHRAVFNKVSPELINIPCYRNQTRWRKSTLRYSLFTPRERQTVGNNCKINYRFVWNWFETTRSNKLCHLRQHIRLATFFVRHILKQSLFLCEICERLHLYQTILLLACLHKSTNQPPSIIL